MYRKSYIVIHGHGGTFLSAVRGLVGLSEFELSWNDGVFSVPQPTGLLLRKLFADGEAEIPLFKALRKLAVSHMLKACAEPRAPLAGTRCVEFPELRINDDFPALAIPLGLDGRMARSRQLHKESCAELVALFNGVPGETLAAAVSRIEASLLTADGGSLEEPEAAEILRKVCGNDGLVDGLRELRDMEELGGDLDTVASATFYVHALCGQAEAAGRKLRYGRDYEYVFVNYHEGLMHLAENCAGGDLYMADVPISCLPDFPEDLRRLREYDIRMLRYEDHHPYSLEQKAMLDTCIQEKLLGFYAMSGPVQGEELPDEALRCGADMVFDALIAGHQWQNPAMSYLRELTHAEDLAQGRMAHGRMLTELIKGGVCKVEISQVLLRCRQPDDLTQMLAENGWEKRVIEKRDAVKKIEERFLENIQLLEIERPEMGDEDSSGPPLDFGSDMPIPKSKRNPDSCLRIMLALAPRTAKNEPKLNIGRACEFFSREMPELDYLFFCYGASILVARRLNQADTSINLAVLMRQIGTEQDGGHAGAAVASPEKNPAYPHRLLGRVSSHNFSRFARYLGEHCATAMGVKIRQRRDLSIDIGASSIAKGGIKLMILILAALLIGLAVVMIMKNYRFDQILEMNRDFFPELEK